MGYLFHLFIAKSASEKKLEGKYTLLRVQIPAKAKFAPTCVRNSLLSELSWECITYLLCVGFVYIEKNPRFTAFLDSNLHTRLAIVTENELGLAFPPRNLPKKFRPDPSTFFSYRGNKQTSKQTDRQTYAGDSIIHRESFRGDNKNCWIFGKVTTKNVINCLVHFLRV